MEKTLILVGGASASGKSTFVKNINESIEDSICYRRVQAFFDYAEFRHIPKEKTFQYITSEDADNWFLNVCENNNCVISDVHYALQMDRTFKTDNSEANIYQEYVPTISESLISKLLSANIKIIAIHISCLPEILYERAISRNQKGQRELRAKSLEDVELQCLHEKKEWLKVAGHDKIESLELDSSFNLPEDLVEQFHNNIINKKAPIKKL